MSALGTTDITTTLIGNTLGISSHVVSALCIDSNIIMWNRFKPTKGAFGDSTFWKGDDGNCGFALPVWLSNSGNAGVYSNSGLWSYIHPNSNYRLGDFRGYNHDSTLKPPFYSFTGTGGNIITSSIDPVENDLVS